MTTSELIAATRSSRPLNTPDPLFDCGWRLLALNYSAYIQPWLSQSQLQYVSDALEIVQLNCNATMAAALISSHVPSGRGGVIPGRLSSAAAATTSIYVDFVKGSDTNGGSITAPLKTVAAAVTMSRTSGTPAQTAIVLRNGTHFLADTITLGLADSGLSFSAFPGETPIVSGAQPLPNLQWTLVNSSISISTATVAGSAPGPVLPNQNNVFGECGVRPGVPNKGVMADWKACQTACLSDTTCTSWTFNSGNTFGAFSNVCCFRTDGLWSPRTEANTFSQNISSKPEPTPSPLPSPSPLPVAWAASLPASSLPPRIALAALPALQVNGHRATLARFPNANSELDLFPVGYIAAATWIHPTPGTNISDVTINEALPAGVEDGGGEMYINFTTGLGGLATRYTPPQSFWASYDFSPNYRWVEMHLRSPSGLNYGTSLPRAPYTRLNHAIVHSWREHHWFSWMFGVGVQNDTTSWLFNAGGHQGGEGCDIAAEWWVEGIKEELDDVNEYFYDEIAGILYFLPNASDATGPNGAPPADAFSAPALSTFFNISGTPAAPVVGISFSGIAFTGGMPTFMDPRGVPSGGDWALERNGVIFLEGTEGVSITDSAFDRIDGNSIFLSGYNRDAVVARNEFSNLGQSAVAAWGRTADGANGWDGSALEVPLNCSVTGNFAHDLGQIQKQSSFYFQAVAAMNNIAGNIVYNIPRCAVNFDDSFGGGTVLARNLFFNTCRECE